MGNLLEEPFYLRSEIERKSPGQHRKEPSAVSAGLAIFAEWAVPPVPFYGGRSEENYYLGCKLQRIRLERAFIYRLPVLFRHNYNLVKGVYGWIFFLIAGRNI